MTTQRAVVVGAGGISKPWFVALKAEGVEVAEVVDLRPEAAEDRIREFGLPARASTDLGRSLRRARPDFVVNLTVPEAHCRVTLAALRAGCHVIGEKPMAATMAEARRMVRAAERAGRLCMISQSRRYNPRHKALRDALAAGAVGPVTAVHCDFSIGAHFGGFRDAMASPLILDMAIHHFDLARYLSAADPVAVYAMEFNPRGSWYAGDAAAVCIFEMTGGIVFTYRGNWCAEGCHTSWNGDWRVVGERGTLIYERDGDPRGQRTCGDTGFHRPLEDVPVPVAPMVATEMHGALHELLDFLRTGRPPMCDAADNIKSLAMVFAAIDSSRRRRRTAVTTGLPTA